MIAAIITRGIGFGGVQFIPTHGFSSTAVAVLPDFVVGTTESLMPVYTTQSLNPVYTTEAISDNDDL